MENSSLELVGSDNVKWLTQIQDIILKSQGLLKKPLFREISDIHDINEKLIQSTKLSRGENYYKVAQLSELIMRQKNNPLKFLYERFSKQILRPLSKDTLYEIAVLFRVIECLKGNGWKETDISLIGEKQDTISILSKGNLKICIFYQKLPNEFAQNSVYMNLMNDYNLGIQNRRPDIILEWIVKEKTKKYTIIEVKRSKNKGYITDGLYKLLGYTKDFQLPLENTKKGMGILVAWQINDFPKAVENEVSLSDWDNLGYSIFKLEEQIFTHFNNAIY
ncbi:hypothetical protein QUF84_13280 [Fictibacillus enclensis]|uniref:hypothetical protein n=1 Tax=Fictibacillus enclensis TaxID=1017270 RepID=UPI0025A1152E|nr:hypothetical protein [Fictibacillus enclensis]MDM5338193.1 hypothetical protein [Fictibacillus enclensis]